MIKNNKKNKSEKRGRPEKRERELKAYEKSEKQ